MKSALSRKSLPVQAKLDDSLANYVNSFEDPSRLLREAQTPIKPLLDTPEPRFITFELYAMHFARSGRPLFFDR